MVLVFLGIIPIYVAHDSADVWANPDIFCLDEETGEAALMAGVLPPDYFSETGQLWGNPVYNWKRLEKTNFQWWIQRIEWNARLCRYYAYRSFPRFSSFLGGRTRRKLPQLRENGLKPLEWLSLNY